MKISKILTVAVILAFTSNIHSQTLSGSTTGEVGGASISLSGAFVAYGDNGSAGVANSVTDLGNIAGFSALSPAGLFTGGTIQTHWTSFGPETYSGVLLGTSTPATSSAAYQQGQQSNFGGSPESDSFSLSSTIFAASETFNFYLENYDTATTINIGLGSGTLSPGTYTDTLGSPASLVDEDVSLVLSGLTVGDTATFTFSTGVNSSDSYPTQTILAATAVSSVPEPSTYAMTLGGLGLLTILIRRRSDCKPSMPAIIH